MKRVQLKKGNSAAHSTFSMCLRYFWEKQIKRWKLYVNNVGVCSYIWTSVHLKLKMIRIRRPVPYQIWSTSRLFSVSLRRLLGLYSAQIDFIVIITMHN